MSKKNREKTQALAKAAESQVTDGKTVAGILERLPNWALAPLMIVVFALLVTDTAVADPVPFIDEATLFWALMSGLKVLGARRRQARALRKLERTEIAVDVGHELRPAPGQPSMAPMVG